MRVSGSRKPTSPDRDILRATAPKIFFRYYQVDSSTGVKSQVMLAETKWEAGA